MMSWDLQVPVACINTTAILRIGARIHRETCVDRVVLYAPLYGSAVVKNRELCAF